MPEIPLKISRAVICKKAREQAKVSFAILRSALLCLKGLRTPRRRNLDVKERDLEIEKGQAGLP